MKYYFQSEVMWGTREQIKEVLHIILQKLDDPELEESGCTSHQSFEDTCYSFVIEPYTTTSEDKE